ncbi:hypothetical protein ILUMI_03000 [Ignelater luminosus]|uniref:CCHC-type domain-containing protein n=1 Tax=Ignelater luminosus TaxID=2038154 RepID=A0A8K0DH75_IGNLU|nr:hypothetical protein ILUMI_03000 [Ignelater luminosus]
MIILCTQENCFAVNRKITELVFRELNYKIAMHAMKHLRDGKSPKYNQNVQEERNRQTTNRREIQRKRENIRHEKKYRHRTIKSAGQQGNQRTTTTRSREKIEGQVNRRNYTKEQRSSDNGSRRYNHRRRCNVSPTKQTRDVYRKKVAIKDKANSRGQKYAKINAPITTANPPNGTCKVLQMPQVRTFCQRMQRKTINDRQKCLNCKSETHLARDCKSETHYCYVCNKQGHKANELACPVYKELVVELRRKPVKVTLKYGQQITKRGRQKRGRHQDRTNKLG